MHYGSALSLILAAASWGLGTVVSKRALDEIPPLTLLPIQLASSVIGLVLLMRAREVPLRAPAVPRLLGPLGLLNPGVAYALSLAGLTSISASLSVLLWTAEPILILLLAVAVLGERVSPAFLALSALAVAGMLLVLYEPGTTGALVGVLLTLAGVVCCAVYSVLSRRWLGAAEATAPIVVAQQAWALGLSLVVLLVAFVAGTAILPVTTSPVGWASAIGSGLVYYAAAYWFYLSALRRLPASTAAASFYLIPVFGLAGGAGALGDRLSQPQWLGALLVLVTVALILRRPMDGLRSTDGSRPVSGGSGSVPRDRVGREEPAQPARAFRDAP